ncbi:unnamed protein product [Calypogeia fissa]
MFCSTRKKQKIGDPGLDRTEYSKRNLNLWKRAERAAGAGENNNEIYPFCSCIVGQNGRQTGWRTGGRAGTAKLFAWLHDDVVESTREEAWFLAASPLFVDREGEGPERTEPLGQDRAARGVIEWKETTVVANAEGRCSESSSGSRVEISSRQGGRTGGGRESRTSTNGSNTENGVEICVVRGTESETESGK